MDMAEKITKRKLKMGIPAIILTATALVFAFINAGLKFFSYEYVGDNYGAGSPYKLTVEMPSAMAWISSFLCIAAIALLLVYFLVGFAKMKLSALVAVAFGLKAVLYLKDISTNLMNAISILTTGAKTAEDMSVPIINSLVYVTSAAMYTVICVFWVLAMISALKGLRSKVFVCVAFALEVVYAFIAVLSSISTLAFGMYMSALAILVYATYSVTFSAAILLFALTNIIPATVKGDAKRRRELKMRPQKALNYLHEIYSFGEITEEEYVDRRVDVLVKSGQVDPSVPSELVNAHNLAEFSNNNIN